MNIELEKRIDAQDAWTFRECLALASEFNTKTRFVVALVMMKGKRYSDGGASFAASDPDSPANNTR
ncbi:MAG: hypothetical protein R3E86_21135 [Pseudomonadales bacterium]